MVGHPASLASDAGPSLLSGILLSLSPSRLAIDIIKEV